MFKRVIWMSTGAAMGAGSAFWAKRKVTRTVERYLPDEVARRAGASARTMGRTVRVAATEGRAAMREREAELRAEADARRSAPTRARRPATEAVPSSAPESTGSAVDARSGRNAFSARTGPPIA